MIYLAHGSLLLDKGRYGPPVQVPVEGGGGTSEIVQGSGNKKWNGAGGLGLILDKNLEHCNRTAFLQKISCYGEVPLKPHPLL